MATSVPVDSVKVSSSQMNLHRWLIYEIQSFQKGAADSLRPG